MIRRILTAILIMNGALLAAAEVGPPALIRIDRATDLDRNRLIAAGVHLVAELSDDLLAVGEPGAIRGVTSSMGLDMDVLASRMPGVSYALVGTTSATPAADLSRCGHVLWSSRNTALVAISGPVPDECRSPQWFFRTLSLRPLAPTRDEPAWLQELATRHRATDPLVAEMVAGLTDDMASAHWQAIVDAAQTRYSYSSGCSDAAAMVEARFTELEISPQTQDHTSGSAPNVIGTIVGATIPDEKIVVIGHLDDMPSTGPAPGANDNASGTAMVTALADIMSCYEFARTVDFAVVTGEEINLLGSTYYAQLAADRGDNIIAVLNADMIGWEGDGSPDPEDLDLNLDSRWPSLGPIFETAATDYATGVVVNSFVCNEMLYSDHAPFWNAGYPAVCAITDNQGFCDFMGSYIGYHTSNDTIANCGLGAKPFHGAALRTFLAVAAELATPLDRVLHRLSGAEGEERSVERIPDRCAALWPDLIFFDGFESGDLSAWEPSP